MSERGRGRLPLYDATAPIVCTIGADEVQGRLGQLEHLRTTVRRLERTEHGLLLHFAADPDLEAELRRFAEVEKQCCAFWGFDVEPTHDGLTLRWDAPPAADDLVQRLVAFLRGDPDADLTGLL